MKQEGGSLFNDKVIKSKEAKKLIDFLNKESNGHTEFRIVVQENGDAYAHVLGRDSATIDFNLKR